MTARVSMPLLALLAACGGAPVPAPAGDIPQAPADAQRSPDVSPEQPVTAERGAWHLELLAHELFANEDGPVLHVWLNGGWQHLQVGPVPRTQGFEFSSVGYPDVDRTGTLVFIGRWHGHPDQAHSIGVGLYTWSDGRAVPIVDAFTAMPGRQRAFNALGLPDIEDGEVAFWGGRDGDEASGVYLASHGQLMAFDMGTGTPDLRSGRLAFQGSTGGRDAGIYLWTRGETQARRIVGIGDPLPDGSGPIQLLFDPVLSDDTVYIPVGLGAGGSPTERAILGYHEETRTLYTVATNAALSEAEGTPTYIQTGSLRADSDALAFTAGAGPRGALWVARGQRLERVLASGDSVDGVPIGNIPDPPREGFRDGVLRFYAMDMDGGGLVGEARRGD